MEAHHGENSFLSEAPVTLARATALMSRAQFRRGRDEQLQGSHRAHNPNRLFSRESHKRHSFETFTG
jgi:hypothetical protein